MSQSLARKHLLRALSLWPKDRLRPACQLQDVLLARTNKNPSSPPSSPSAKAEFEDTNALYSLLDNRYEERFRPKKGLLIHPASNPNHYSDIRAEIEAAPGRGIWDRIRNRLGGLLRLS